MQVWRILEYKRQIFKCNQHDNCTTTKQQRLDVDSVKFFDDIRNVINQRQAMAYSDDAFRYAENRGK